MPGSARIKLALLVAVVAAAAIGVAATTGAQEGGGDRIEATLTDARGETVGKVRMRETPYGTIDVRAHLRILPPGFHGFHIHAVGACTAPDFRSAGGHAAVDGQTHGNHVGDLPPLLVKTNGTATMRVTTDRFDLDRLRDVDGSAIIVHALPDNLANIPSRYAPDGPDEETRNTGDAGGRIACGIVGG